MYREHFGFRELPFSIAPDPRFLYMGELHREAMAHLVYGMNTDGGFVLLTGDVGTGKTTICRAFLDQIRENTDVAFVLNPRMTAEELLATLCDELGIDYPEGNRSIKVFVDGINTYLLDAFARGRKTLLIIEESQNLVPDVLEQVRLLTNLETNQQKLLKIIMIGQPEMKGVLSRPEMEQLSQRITARYHIGPLSKNEVHAYVSHRLSVAGAKTRLFPASLIGRLHRLSRGVPRLINVICDRALLGAYAEGKDIVDKKTLIRASREVFGEPEIRKETWKKRRRLAVTAMLIFFGTALAIIFSYQPTQLNSKAKEAPSAAVKGTEAGKPDALQWSSLQPVDVSRSMAYRALFKEWNLSYQEESGDACKYAGERGLRCLEGSGSLKALIGLNRPAVLRLLGDDGKDIYGTVRKVEGRNAVVVIGAETRRVDFSEIERRWSGDYRLFWKAPGNYHGNIHPGDAGADLTWLHKLLSFAQGRKPQTQSAFKYNNDMVNKVKTFQLDEGLSPDGIVGPQTIIHLLNKNGTDGPLLKASKEANI